MRIARFRGPDPKEALRQVKVAMGADAVVLSSKTSEDGEFEIVAAVDLEEVAAGGPDSAQPARRDSATAALKDLLREILREARAIPSGDHLCDSAAAVCGGLVAAGVAPHVALTCCADIRPDEPMSQIAKRMVDRVRTAPPQLDQLGAPGGRALHWAFVGSTGTGKTTTIAKLAASLHLERALRVALVSTDVERLGAAHELAQYAALMDVPFALATDRRSLVQVLGRHTETDVVLIDTPGASPKDETAIGRIADVLRAAECPEVHLCLDVGMRSRELADCLERFAPCGVDRIVFTKLDEATGLGNLLNASFLTPHPLSYLTHGRRIPEDHMVATPMAVARLVLGLEA